MRTISTRVAACLIAASTAWGAGTAGAPGAPASAGTPVTAAAPTPGDGASAGSTPPQEDTPSQDDTPPEVDEGPRSPVGRRPERTRITRAGGTVTRVADFGDITLGTGGRYRAPLRGVLVTPDRPAAHAGLVVIDHLRYPGCSDLSFAYPCPAGTTERRYDIGMAYLGQALARQGYAVLIPDLGPLYIPGLLDSPYDQGREVMKVVSRLRGWALAASQGRATRWGGGMRGALRPGPAGLVVHSRSASTADDLVRAWARSTTPIRSVMSYGASYDVAYAGEPGTTPMISDVPYLGLLGDEDRDTGWSASHWLGHHVEGPRRSPALVAAVPGLGHTLVNRTLSSAGIDDRICSGACPDARVHERTLVRVAQDWLGATLRHRRTTLPLRPDAALPARLAGMPARWLAVTNGPRRTVLLPGVTGSVVARRPATVRTCLPPEPMAPSRPGACPQPDSGILENPSRVAQVALTPTAGVTMPTKVRGVRGLALHLSPFGDRADGRPGTALRVTVRTSSGRTAVLTVPARHPALVDRRTAVRSGVYPISTVRLPLPGWVRAATVTGVTLTTVDAPGRIELRAVDALL